MAIGTFTGPGVSATLTLCEEVSDPTEVLLTLIGLCAKVIVACEISTDGGTTWTEIREDTGPTKGTVSVFAHASHLVGLTGVPNLFRLRCTYFDSGSLQWTITQ